MKRLIAVLPGPPVVQYLTAAAVVVAALVVLYFVYDWIGTNLLDTGGTVG